MEAYWYWLCHELYLERNWARELLAALGSPRAVFEAPIKDLEKLFPGKTGRHLDILENRKNWDLEGAYEEVKSSGTVFYSCESEEFPPQLLQIPDSPLGIFVRGKLPEPDRLSVAIVGARICSSYGQMTARTFARDLADRGVQVISGMAAGVDGHAHRGALEGKGHTFAVLGCGAERCYPRQNRDIYEAITGNGGVLSEYPPGTPPLPMLFPMRNRLISGLSRAVLVVEAREKSGSLITANLALEQGKEVFAVPGRICDSLSQGCNRLLQQGAGMVLSAEELLESLGMKAERKAPMREKNKKSLESSEELVYSCLGLQAQHIEEISRRCGLPLIQVMRLLISLELKGYACEIRKNYYSRKHL